MRRFSRAYGSSPAHLLLVLAAFAVSAYAIGAAFARQPPLALTKWFIGAIIGHDLIALPLYSAVLILLLAVLGGRAAREGRPIPRTRRLVINHLRVPAGLSLLALALFYPLVLGLAEGGYHAVSGLTTAPYLERWLLLSAALFAVSAVLLVLRLVLGRRGERAGARAPAESPS